MNLHKILGLDQDKPTLEDYQSDCFVLQCPYCESSYTHQQSPIPVPGEKTRLSRDTKEFVSTGHRQGGIAIPFFCENCTVGRIYGFYLVIAQHKGNTWIQVAKVITDEEIKE